MEILPLVNVLFVNVCGIPKKPTLQAHIRPRKLCQFYSINERMGQKILVWVF